MFVERDHEFGFDRECLGHRNEGCFLFTAKPQDVAERVKALMDDRKALQAEVAKLRRELAMGSRLEITLPLWSLSAAPQELTVDYVLHFLKANGQRAPKVFKGTVLTLGPGQERVVRLTHHFREVTTRRHYAGEQALSFRINGVDTVAVPFLLTS